MYVQFSQYRLGAGSVQELVESVEEGNLPLMRQVPGMRDYYAIDVGDGVVASVIVFEDRTGAEEAERMLADWVEETVARFEITPGPVIEGEVIATARGER